MRRKRDSLPRSTRLWFYLGSTVALVALILIGYRLERNLALPVFLLFLVLVTIAGARQERAERQAEETTENHHKGDIGG
jgi:4-hydroxybenzoate polyprenyltransferase